MTSSGDDPYPIIEIQPDWVREEEAMGSKEKFWFQEQNAALEWLFKYPQSNTGQHWAEKIAAEVAAALDIVHARVELAVFQGVQGSATLSFARGGRELYHGNQVLAGRSDYDPRKRFRQSDHILGNILEALDRVFKTSDSAHRAKLQLGAYLVLDAVIGNTDRHHENWGILRKRTANGWTGWLAPTFDHASSLGRELRDEGAGKCRQRLLNEGRVGWYSERAPGAIYWESSDRHGLSPLALVRQAAARYPALFAPPLRRLDALTESELTRIVRRVPADWMTRTAGDFTVALMCYNIAELKKIAT